MNPDNAVAEALEMTLARRYGPADNITLGDARRLYSLLKSYRATTGEGHRALGEAVVRDLKRLKGWPTPLRWFTRTNVKHNWIIVSYHHRSQLCWEWGITLCVGKAARQSAWNPWHWFGRGWHSIFFGVPWLFRITFSWQSYGWMLSSDGENLIRFTAQARRVDEGGVS